MYLDRSILSRFWSTFKLWKISNNFDGTNISDIGFRVCPKNHNKIYQFRDIIMIFWAQSFVSCPSFIFSSLPKSINIYINNNKVTQLQDTQIRNYTPTVLIFLKNSKSHKDLYSLQEDTYGILSSEVLLYMCVSKFTHFILDLTWIWVFL